MVVGLLAGVCLAGCRKAGPHAGGAGYGAGIARTALTFGNEPQAGGFDTTGVSAPTERGVGRIKAAPAEPAPATPAP